MYRFLSLWNLKSGQFQTGNEINVTVYGAHYAFIVSVCLSVCKRDVLLTVCVPVIRCTGWYTGLGS